MGWDFETDDAFQVELDWIDQFVRNEVEPLDHVLGSPYDVKHPHFVRLVRPLQQQVRERDLWACHLGPELGGPGYGQVKLALMNEILGRSRFGPVVFGCQAPDTGNAEILAHYGTPEQKQRFLAPLLANQLVSCFAMTEPHGGADPLMMQTQAVREGEHWVLTGEKWFASNARLAAFFIVMAITDPEAKPHRRTSMFIVPADHLLGEQGEGFAVAQTRLGGGRIHHAMRTIGQARQALDLLCRRALSRRTQGDLLAHKQMVQEKIADSWIELEQFRLLVLRTAWRIDRYNDYRRVRQDIAAVKAAMPKVLHDIAARALQVHGSIGTSDEMPFMEHILSSFVLGLADGPTEVHKVTVARELLRSYQADDDVFPDYHLPRQRAQALARYANVLNESVPQA